MQGAKKLNVSSTGILPCPRQNDWAKTRRILAHSSWQPVKNTENLQCFAAFWAGGCAREFWPSRCSSFRWPKLLLNSHAASCCWLDNAPHPNLGRLTHGITTATPSRRPQPTTVQSVSGDAIAVSAKNMPPGSVCTSGDGPGLQNQWGV